MGQDLSINGLGSAAGGSFQRAEINGKGTVNGDIDCIVFECNGRGVVNGNIKARTVEVNGSASLYGNIEAMEIEISGHARMEGDIAGKEVEVSGNATIGGDLRAGKVELNGKVSIEADCEAEEFEGDGHFNVNGSLNATNIDIVLRAESSAKEINAQTVKVRRRAGGWFTQLKNSFFPAELSANVIEGDEVDLNYTKANIVRGNNVRIGPGCKIDLVEYKGNLQEDRSAKVKEKRKV